MLSVSHFADKKYRDALSIALLWGLEASVAQVCAVPNRWCLHPHTKLLHLVVL